MATIDLSGRAALVTGAARGLGRAAALRMLEGGAAVALNVRRAEQVAALAEDLSPFGGRAMTVLGDVADPAAAASMVGEVVARFGRLDVLVNNAAAAYSTRFEQISE